jgi:phosphoribosyl 1,2-cyclic phosphodiesterase
MHINVLASSSEGNCTHISTDDASILIDAGISAKRIFELSGTKHFDAVFISHEHGDHVTGVGPLGRKTGVQIYMHELTFNKIEGKLKDCNVNLWAPGEAIQVNDLEINNFSTRHDSAYSYGFIVKEDGGRKLGYLTDTGSWTKLMAKHLKDCDGYIIEADYDAAMLEAYDDYDEYLKQRISSNWGHLSNDQTFDLLEALCSKEPEFISFAHLSPRTNEEELLLKTARDRFTNWKPEVFNIAPMKMEL